MTRKEKTQQNRFDTKIAPLLKELTKLCDKFGMPMLTAVQLFENDETGARVNTQATHPQEMSLPMTLSTSLMNGSTKVRIDASNMLQLVMPKNEIPEMLKKYAVEGDVSMSELFTDEELEPLPLHATHCDDCRILMEEAILRGERVDNIVVPKHDDVGLKDPLDELKKSKLPIIFPKNNIIH